jgi:hypothetical protein
MRENDTTFVCSGFDYVTWRRITILCVENFDDNVIKLCKAMPLPFPPIFAFAGRQT